MNRKMSYFNIVLITFISMLLIGCTYTDDVNKTVDQLPEEIKKLIH